MTLQSRNLRACVDNIPQLRPRLSARELDREDKILDAAQAIMARHGRAGLTMASFATAIRMSSATIRRHFADIDSILQELLIRHLRAIDRALGQVPRNHPDYDAALRAAYIAYTRINPTTHTECHALLLRERHALPPDLAERVESARANLAQTLAFKHADAALALLDTPGLQAEQVETMLAALSPPPAKRRHDARPRRPNHPKPQTPFAPLLHTPPTATIQARAGPIA